MIPRLLVKLLRGFLRLFLFVASARDVFDVYEESWDF